ncbi:MAG: VWA domain-containing protein [Jatrophihabitans sp.]|nr:MAG: VWA domain-containing protein [Jatrophihabitans sp.]
MRDALQGASAQDMARIREMMHALNEMLDADARGEHTQQDFDAFMQRFGEFFPDNPRSLEELIDSLARRAAAAQRLLDSLTAEQRAELESLMAQALGDAGLAEEMARLQQGLRSARPDLRWGGRQRIGGEQPLGFADATGALAELADLDELDDLLGQDYPGASLEDIDEDLIREALGQRAVDDLARLRRIENELRQQGYLRRSGEGLTLTPRALRRLGSTALRRVFAVLESRGRGGHDMRDAGAAGEVTGASREWRFGDEQPLDVVRTVGNAVLRNATRTAGAPRPATPGAGAGHTWAPTVGPGAPRPATPAAGAGHPWAPTVGPGAPRPATPGAGARNTPAPTVGPGAPRPATPGAGAVEIAGEDFEVVETERRSSAAVALLVDMSYSMELRGTWGEAKTTALALHALIATRYPQDAIEIIGFSDYARVMTTGDLVDHDWDRVQGTNLQHGLMLARRFLDRHRNAEPIVLVITDGEPTAHIARDGFADFAWPPTVETITATLVEVERCTRRGATINIFMLDDDPRLVSFMHEVGRRNGGRVFLTRPGALGEYVVSDYLRARRGRRTRRAG